MAGKNPYIEETEVAAPKKKYHITFLPQGKTIEVEVAAGTSILDAARKCGAQVGSACGGVCACSTCHVHVKEGLESCNEAGDAELDELDEARDVTLESRLGCQCVPDGTADVEVVVPAVAF